MLRTFVKVYMELGSYFLFLQEEIKDIIIIIMADAGAPAVLAPAPAAVMLANAGTPTVFGLAPEAVMLADAGAPAVLVGAPLAAMLADAGAPQSLQMLLRRLCS